jgi:hypothetical protein
LQKESSGKSWKGNVESLMVVGPECLVVAKKGQRGTECMELKPGKQWPHWSHLSYWVWSSQGPGCMVDCWLTANEATDESTGASLGRCLGTWYCHTTWYYPPQGSAGTGKECKEQRSLNGLGFRFWTSLYWKLKKQGLQAWLKR